MSSAESHVIDKSSTVQTPTWVIKNSEYSENVIHDYLIIFSYLDY